MAVRYAALSVSLYFARWRDVTLGNNSGTDGQTDRQTDRVRRNMRPPPREEGRIINNTLIYKNFAQQ